MAYLLKEKEDHQLYTSRHYNLISSTIEQGETDPDLRIPMERVYPFNESKESPKKSPIKKPMPSATIEFKIREIKPLLLQK